MQAFFKVYNDQLASAPVEQVYNLFPKIQTNIIDDYAINFDPNVFLRGKTTEDGEIKLPKGLWKFTISFAHDVIQTNNSPLSYNNEIFSVNLNMRVFLNKKETNDRPPVLYNGLKDGILNYTFILNNPTDDALFSIDFKPVCKRTNLNAMGTVSGVSIVIKNFSFIGEMLHSKSS